MSCTKSSSTGIGSTGSTGIVVDSSSSSTARGNSTNDIELHDLSMATTAVTIATSSAIVVVAAVVCCYVRHKRQQRLRDTRAGIQRDLLPSVHCFTIAVHALLLLNNDRIMINVHNRMPLTQRLN